MTFNDLKTGKNFEVDKKDIKLAVINSRYFAIAKSPDDHHDVWKEITMKEYNKIRKTQ